MAYTVYTLLCLVSFMNSVLISVFPLCHYCLWLLSYPFSQKRGLNLREIRFTVCFPVSPSSGRTNICIQVCRSRKPASLSAKLGKNLAVSRTTLILPAPPQGWQKAFGMAEMERGPSLCGPWSASLLPRCMCQAQSTNIAKTILGVEWCCLRTTLSSVDHRQLPFL